MAGGRGREAEDRRWRRGSKYRAQKEGGINKRVDGERERAEKEDMEGSEPGRGGPLEMGLAMGSAALTDTSNRPKHTRQFCSLLSEWKSADIQRINDVKSNARLQWEA